MPSAQPAVTRPGRRRFAAAVHGQDCRRRTAAAAPGTDAAAAAAGPEVTETYPVGTRPAGDEASQGGGSREQAGRLDGLGTGRAGGTPGRDRGSLVPRDPGG